MPIVETELKLAVTPRTLARIAQDPLLGVACAAPQQLLALYFDTSRRSLWRRKLTLRVRRESGQWLQTVKGGGSVEAGLHRRIELTWPTADAVPELDRLGESEPEQAVAEVARRAPLAEAFRIEIERDSRLLQPAPGVEIEVCLDRGRILGAGSRTPVCEIEFELKQGPPCALFDLALAVAARHTVRLERRSKAERGYELIGALRPAPVRGNLHVVRRGMSAGDAFHAAATSCLDHLQANQHGVIRGADPEFLHQARVALRRLRSVIDAFDALLPPGQRKPRLKTLRQLTRALGPARDWDVFAAETLAPVLQQFPGHRGLTAIARASERLREESNRAARRSLVSRRSQRQLIDLCGWIAARSWQSGGDASVDQAWNAPVREYAAAVLAQYHRRLLKRGRGVGFSGLARLHRLRIATKKLRYAASYFAPLFPRARSASMLAALNDLQDLLGAINDCASAPGLIDAATAAARGALRPQARTIIGHWNAAMLAERRDPLKRTWKAVRRCDAFWT